MSKIWGPIVPRKRQGTTAELLAEKITRYTEALARTACAMATLGRREGDETASGNYAASSRIFHKRSLPLARRSGMLQSRIKHYAVELQRHAAAAIEERNRAEALAEVSAF